MDGQAYYADQLAWQREAERVLSESTKRPLTIDEATLLAWAANLRFKQGEMHEMGR